MTLKSASRLLLLASLLVLAAGPLMAQPYPPALRGIDLWETSSPTYVDFSDNPLPAGFFPGCALPYSGQIVVTGRRIRATQSLGSTDTILERTQDISFPAPSYTGSSPLVIRALCLQNRCWTDPCGNPWRVRVRLRTGATQPLGTLTATATNVNGGTFNSNFTVRGEVSFTNGTLTLGPVAEDLTLITTNATWARTPPPGGVTVASPVYVDSNCDDIVELRLPGTTNFFPWNVTHTGPHPVLPPRQCEGATSPVGQQQVPGLGVVPVFQCPDPAGCP